MKSSLNNKTVQLYANVGILAIIAGGLLAGFSAKHPTTFPVWASAYLVLVVGVLQVGFGRGLQRLASGASQTAALWAFAVYNIGNLLVILGTALKYAGTPTPSIIAGGGTLLVVAMLLLCYAIRNAEKSRIRTGFYIIVAIVIVSMPIGLVLARQ